MNKNVHFLGITLACCSFAVPFSGCRRESSPPSLTAPSPQVSTIQIERKPGQIRITSSKAEFVLLPSGYLQAFLIDGGKRSTLDDASATGGQKLLLENNRIAEFSLDLAQAKIEDASGKIGKLGKKLEVRGNNPENHLDEFLTIEIYDDFPSMVFSSAKFQNAGSSEIKIEKLELQQHRLNASLADSNVSSHEMWAFFGSSRKWGQDDVFPVPAKFTQENPFSLPVPAPGDPGGAGGGIPIAAFWTRSLGIAIGHIETLPLVVSIPAKTEVDGRISAAIKVADGLALKPGETYSSPRTFLAVYSGDFYEPVRLWSQVIEREGLSHPENNDENYAVSWCGWGYRSNVTPKQMLDTIPKLKELGIHWATLDDRWFNNYGDWKARPDTFPGNSIEEMVRTYHSNGIKVQIWWLPLLVEDGHHGFGDHPYEVSDVVKEHPDWLILDKNGKPARSTRNLAMLCPALPEVREYHKQLTERFIRDWDFDGHKLDNIFATPPCYNPRHHHKSPDDSVYAMGEIYKTIFETTRALKADSVTQSCPCGTPPSLAWFRYMDQGVTGDPLGSVQVRERIKLYKALLGPRAAVYGDHVELTKIVAPETPRKQDLGQDFASTLGTGGVLGTKFTWPEYGSQFKPVYLTPEKESHWKKWIGLYNEKMLSKGEFRNLYNYGYDWPEAYAIEKDGRMYYAFYAAEKPGTRPENSTTGKIWEGEIELRGLKQQSYRIRDYVNGQDLGAVQGPFAKLKMKFTDDLLIEVVPEKSN